MGKEGCQSVRDVGDAEGMEVAVGAWVAVSVGRAVAVGSEVAVEIGAEVLVCVGNCKAARVGVAVGAGSVVTTNCGALLPASREDSLMAVALFVVTTKLYVAADFT